MRTRGAASTAQHGDVHSLPGHVFPSEPTSFFTCNETRWFRLSSIRDKLSRMASWKSLLLHKPKRFTDTKMMPVLTSACHLISGGFINIFVVNASGWSRVDTNDSGLMEVRPSEGDEHRQRGDGQPAVENHAEESSSIRETRDSASR